MWNVILPFWPPRPSTPHHCRNHQQCRSFTRCRAIFAIMWCWPPLARPLCSRLNDVVTHPHCLLFISANDLHSAIKPNILYCSSHSIIDGPRSNPSIVRAKYTHTEYIFHVAWHKSKTAPCRAHTPIQIVGDFQNSLNQPTTTFDSCSIICNCSSPTKDIYAPQIGIEWKMRHTASGALHSG